MSTPSVDLELFWVPNGPRKSVSANRPWFLFIAWENRSSVAGDNGLREHSIYTAIMAMNSPCSSQISITGTSTM